MKTQIVKNNAGLNKLEERRISTEFLPQARKTSYAELVCAEAGSVPYDDYEVYVIEIEERTYINAISFAKMISKSLQETPLSVLSIGYEKKQDRSHLMVLLLGAKKIEPVNYIKSHVKDVVEQYIVKDETREVVTGAAEVDISQLSKKHVLTEADIAQRKIYEASTPDAPFLNTLDTYRRQTDDQEIMKIYDMRTEDMKTRTSITYSRFKEIFNEIITYFTGVERSMYVNAQKGEIEQDYLMEEVATHIDKNYSKDITEEDKELMLKRLRTAFFGYYVIQGLIDDPNVTDIKITAPDEIRARVKGKALTSNLTFMNARDYIRFVEGLGYRTGIEITHPAQTFTDEHDKDYILRFSITAAYVNARPFPYLHIRKIPRHKMNFDDLVRAGMMDEKIRDFLIDCATTSRGIVFAGPPGSGKTYALNAYIDHYPAESEVLVIQENDELYTDKPGYMFQHVVNVPPDNCEKCSLEDLGRLALVAGCNVFVIGESKGPEITSAITLANSGCRTAITIHSPSATQTADKMANLAVQSGYMTIDMAKRALTAFQTIVYMQDFKVQEIAEITGYDEEKKDLTYRYLYKRSLAEPEQ